MPHYEVSLRRMRPADAIRGAPPSGGRHARGGVSVPDVRPGRGAAHEPHGDPAGRVSGREDRREDDRAAAAPNGEGDGPDGAGRTPRGQERGTGEGGKASPPLA